jgi:oligopeptide transport system permease protein
VNDVDRARLGHVAREGGTRLAACILVAVVVYALAAPALSPWPYDGIDWDAIDTPPSAAHWLGTDTAGRDLFVRIAMGARTSLTVALLATAVSFAIGLPWGAIAGYAGGRVDQVMMRVVDVLYALPFVFVVILLVVVFGRNLYLLFVALGAVSWLDLARIVRGQTLRLREETFVLAARALGQPSQGILRHHVVPNLLGPTIVYTTLTVPGVMLAESFLSFLGLGVQEPLTSLGRLVAEGAAEMESAPWQLLAPSAVLATILLCLNFLGDGLRDALDPRQRL